MIAQFKNYRVSIEADERPLPEGRTAQQLMHSHFVKLSIIGESGEHIVTATRHGYQNGTKSAGGQAMPLTNLQRYLALVEPVAVEEAATPA